MPTMDEIIAAKQAGGSAVPPTPGIKDEIPVDEKPPQKRGRGRPSNADKATESIQAQINASGSSESPKTAKARKVSQAQIKFDAAKLGKQLQGIHAIISKVTGMPFMQIEEDESFALAQAIIGVADQYDLTIDPRVAAGLQLLATAAMIYGPRALMFTAMKKQMQAQMNAKRPRNNEGAQDVPHNPAG